MDIVVKVAQVKENKNRIGRFLNTCPAIIIIFSLQNMSFILYHLCIYSRKGMFVVSGVIIMIEFPLRSCWLCSPSHAMFCCCCGERKLLLLMCRVSGDGMGVEVSLICTRVQEEVEEIPSIDISS